MGLLDFNLDNLDSPGARMGLGLLAAAGPQAVPMSFGQRLAGAMGQLRAEKAAEEERKLKAALMNAQIQDMAAQAKLREAQAAKSGEADKLLREVLGAQSAPSQYGMAGGGINLGGVQERMTPRAGGLAGATPEQIALLKLKGIDVTDQWKAAKNGFEQKPGTFYKDATTGETRYQEDPTKGLGYSGGRVSLIPGAAEAQAALSGATKEAEARAGAMYQLKDGVDAQGNPTVLGTVAGIADQLRGPQRGSPLDQVRAAMARNGDASAQFDIGGMRGTLQGSQRGGLRTGLGEREKTAIATEGAYDAEVAKDMASRRKAILDSGDGAGKTIGSLRLISQLLRDHDGGRYSETGLEIASALNGMGIKIDKNLGNKEAARALQVQLTKDALGGSLGPGVSNTDVQFLQKMTPNLGMSAEGRQRLVDALMAIEQRKQEVSAAARKYESKYGRIDGRFFQQLEAWASSNPLFRE